MKLSRFSISIAHDLENWELVFDLLYEEYFKGIELPAYYLNNSRLPGLLDRSGMQITNVLDLVQPSISRNITEQLPKVQKDVFEHINSIISKKYDFALSNFTLDLGFDAQSDKNNTVSSKIQFLKQFSYILYLNNITMTLPVRIPDPEYLNEHGRYILEIIHGTMFNGFKICLNLHPHEIKKNIDPEKFFYWYDFDLKSVRLIYEPETGNYITEKLLEYWIKPLDTIAFKGDIIFCPQTRNFTLFENEIKNLTGLIDKIKI